MKPKKSDSMSKRKKNIILVSSVLIAVLALGLLFIGSGGEKNRGNITAQTSAPQTSGAQTPATTQETNVEDIIVPPLSIYRRRNPFKPLVNMEAPEAAATTPTGTGGVVVIPPEIEAGLSNPVVSRAITLGGITREKGKTYASIRVSDSVFDKVGVGDVFADNYKLISLGNDGTATILYGDERFTISVGQSVYW